MSWSARNERSSREESSNFESYQFQQQIEQQRSMQQHMQWMQQQETLRRQSQERQSREQERSQVKKESVQESRSQEVAKTQERSTSRKGARTVIDILKHNKEEKQEKEAVSSAASLKKASLSRKESAAEVTPIPVKNYRSRTLSRSGRRREPSPPVDYPSGAGAEYSDDTDETNDVRIAEYEASQGGRGRSMRRKASTQSFSKKTSVTRNYPGCVIA